MSVHVAALDVDDAVLARLTATLSGDERRRAAALADGPPRRRFIADHGLRRRLLGAALGVAPEAVACVVDPAGRPRLHGAGPRFSASRNEGVAVYALCPRAEVGVDVERVPVGDGAAQARLARRVLSAREHGHREALAPARRTAALYACWTRKEAYGKALGQGLIFPLTEIEAWDGGDRPVRCGETEIRTLDLALIGERLGVGGTWAGALAVRIAAGVQLAVTGPAVVTVHRGDRI